MAEEQVFEQGEVVSIKGTDYVVTAVSYQEAGSTKHGYTYNVRNKADYDASLAEPAKDVEVPERGGNNNELKQTTPPTSTDKPGAATTETEPGANTETSAPQ